MVLYQFTFLLEIRVLYYHKSWFILMKLYQSALCQVYGILLPYCLVYCNRALLYHIFVMLKDNLLPYLFLYFTVLYQITFFRVNGILLPHILDFLMRLYQFTLCQVKGILLPNLSVYCHRALLFHLFVMLKDNYFYFILPVLYQFTFFIELGYYITLFLILF